MLHFQHLFFSHHCRRISWLLALWLMLLFVSLGARAQDCPSLVESDFDISYLAGNADCNTRPAVKLAYKGHVAGFTQFYVEFSSDGLHWKNKQSFQIDRVDYIIPLNGGKPVVLEVNTTPGMTTTSFIPQQIRAAGLQITEVMTEIIENELNNR